MNGYDFVAWKVFENLVWLNKKKKQVNRLDQKDARTPGVLEVVILFPNWDVKKIAIYLEELE